MQTIQQMLLSFGASIAIIQSVQHFSIAVNAGSASNTATISSVTTANAFILYGGQSEDQAADNPNQIHAGLTLTNSTTVTATRNSSSTTSIVINGCVVEFKSGVINSNQSGTISLVSATSNTATISSVNTSLAFVHFQGNTYSSSTAKPETVEARVTLTNSTTVTATVGVSGSTTNVVYYTVIEFTSTYINSVQQITPQLTTTSTSQDTTITSVTTGATMLIWGGFDITQTTTHREGIYPTASLTSATNVNISRFDSLTGTINVTITVIEFKSQYIKSLQRGSNQIAGSGTSATNTITSVTTGNTALNYCGQTRQSSGSDANSSGSYGYIALTNGTTITGTRIGGVAGGLNTGWEAIEFN